MVERGAAGAARGVGRRARVPARASARSTARCRAAARRRRRRRRRATRSPARSRSPSRTPRSPPSPTGRRRVVLTTDIAETSLTVDGVRIVVDSGLARAPRFDARTGMTRLTTVSTSRASADQRAGRAGRTEPGRRATGCGASSSTAPATPTARPRSPRSTSPGSPSSWPRGTPSPSSWRSSTAPPAKAFAAARALLGELGALDHHGLLTDLGRQMLGLPVHPRLARMVAVSPDSRWRVSSRRSSTSATCCAGGPTSCRPTSRSGCAVVAGSAIARPGRPLGRRAVARPGRRHRPAIRHRASTATRSHVDTDALGATLLLAFPDRLAGRRRTGQFQLRTGSGAWLPDTDPLAAEDVRRRRRPRRQARPGPDPARRGDRRRRRGGGVRRRARRDANAGVGVEPRRSRRERRAPARLDPPRQSRAVRRRPATRPSPRSSQRVRATQLAVLGWTANAIRLRERVEFLHRTVGEPWPDWSVATLVAHARRVARAVPRRCDRTP